MRRIRIPLAEVSVFHLDLLFDQDNHLTHLKFWEDSPTAIPDWQKVGKWYRCAGLRAICLLVIKAKLGETLDSEEVSAACTLYELKRSGWTSSLFQDKHRSFYEAISRSENGQRRSHFTASLVREMLSAGEIRVGRGDPSNPSWLEGPDASSELRKLADSLEKSFQARNDSESGTKQPPEVLPLTPPRTCNLACPVQVAVLLGSTNLPYTEAIYSAFRTRLKASVQPEPLITRVKSLPDDASAVEESMQLAWDFRNSKAAKDADYWVTIGSPAVVALHRTYGSPDKLQPDKPMLALGVTNPLALALPAKSGHKRPIAVICYGKGMGQYYQLLDEIVFKDVKESRRRFAFVYHQGIQHDVGAVDDLRGVLRISKQLKVYPFPHFPKVDDLRKKCGDRIIWGWYTVEYLLKEGKGEWKDHKGLMVVSTIQQHAQAGLSAVAVQPLDEEIGELGAQWLVEDLATGGARGESFKARDAESTLDYFWLNLDVMKDWETALEFQLSEEVKYHPLCKGRYSTDRSAGNGKAETVEQSVTGALPQ